MSPDFLIAIICILLVLIAAIIALIPSYTHRMDLKKAIVELEIARLKSQRMSRGDMNPKRNNKPRFK